LGGAALLLGLLLSRSTCQAESVLPSPVPAETAVGEFVLHPECRIELVAAEPDVVDPVSIAFGPDGRLWVVEYSDYPNGPPADGPPLSRIRVLSDPDGDGRYGNPIVFAEQLLFANSLMLWEDGAIVTTDGAVLFLRDRDGDGRADERQEWFRGFARENPQLRANHPTLGLDGQIYIASGLRGGEVIATRSDWAAHAQPVSLSGRDFRFDPRTGRYESVSGVGQFGLCFDPFGQRFLCSNRNPCMHVVLEDHYQARNPNLAVAKVTHDVSPAAENSKLFPISRTWTTSNLHANQFTAACGVLIFGGSALPQFRGHSFTCEPTANLVHHDVLAPQGASFVSRPGREEIEFLATRDEWFRPVNLAHGPDGALYVVDMYRAVIEHPQFMPDELKTRPDLVLGNDRGRIYRIVSRDAPDRTRATSFRTDPPSLLTHLASSNAWHRDTAFRLLLQHPPARLTEQLVAFAQSDVPDESRVAAWSLLSALGQLTRDSVLSGLRADSPRVRAAVLRLAERAFPEDPKVRDAVLAILHQPNGDSQLHFQAILSLGAFPATPDVTQALIAMAVRYSGDAWFRAAVASSGGDALVDILNGVRPRGEPGGTTRRDEHHRVSLELIRQLTTMVGSRNRPDEVRELLRSLTEDASLKMDDRERVLFVTVTALNDGLRRARTSLGSHLDRLSDSERAYAADLFARARAIAADSSSAEDLRREAIQVCAVDTDPAAVDVLAELLKRETSQPLLVEAAAALSAHKDPQIAESLLDGFRNRTPAVRLALLNALLAGSDRTRRLLDEIEAGRLTSRDIDAATSARLARSTDAGIRERATRLLTSAIDADRARVIAEYETCLSQPGDPARGRALFSRICAQCHKVGDLGTNVGPDISDSRTKTPEFLLTNILDPNRAVDGNYFGYTALGVDGRVHTGIITAETASSVTLRLPEGKEVTLLRTEIEELVNTGLSLMPNGLEKGISVTEMGDVVSFIKNWRYVDGQVPLSGEP
jgi:putative membrane-bound dehydrogenase-like protein